MNEWMNEFSYPKLLLQNAQKCTISGQKFKKFSGRGHSPLPPRRLRRVDLAPPRSPTLDPPLTACMSITLGRGNSSIARYLLVRQLYLLVCPSNSRTATASKRLSYRGLCCCLFVSVSVRNLLPTLHAAIIARNCCLLIIIGVTNNHVNARKKRQPTHSFCSRTCDSISELNLVTAIK